MNPAEQKAHDKAYEAGFEAAKNIYSRQNHLVWAVEQTLKLCDMHTSTEYVVKEAKVLHEFVTSAQGKTSTKKRTQKG